MLIQLLDEKLESIRVHFTDEVRYDQEKPSAGMRVRSVAWRLGDTEFLVSYHEVQDVPGTAVYRIRTQPYAPGETRDEWQDIPTLGELDAALREAKRRKGYAAGDLRAIRGATKHEGPTPEGLILVGLTGSTAYGLNHQGFTDPETGKVSPPSDEDTRGVFVVPTVHILSLEKPKVIVEQRETETTFDEIERFLHLCLKGNPERLEMLAAPKRLITEEGQWLIENQHIFLSKLLIKTYGGYAKQQLYRIERKQERSTKPMMHLIRLMIMGIRILREGRVNVDMQDHRDALLAIRFGQMPIEEVFRWHKELEVEFAKAAKETKLPDHPDWDAANKILLAVRRMHLHWQ